MPVLFGTKILTVTYTAATKKLSVTGKAFGINQYASSNIGVRLNGSPDITYVASIDSWADEHVTGTLAAELAAGSWDIIVVSSDGEQAVSLNAVTVSPASSTGEIFFQFQNSK